MIELEQALEKGLRGVGTFFSKFGLKVPFMLYEHFMDNKKYLPGVFAFATGTRGGKHVRIGVSMTSEPMGEIKKSNMGALTGVPLAVGLSLLHGGKISRRGVFAPEGAINPDIFFTELAPLCNPERSSHVDLLEIHAMA